MLNNMGTDYSIELAKINLKLCIFNMISILFIQVSREQRTKIHPIYVSGKLVFFPIFYICFSKVSIKSRYYFYIYVLYIWLKIVRED